MKNKQANRTGSIIVSDLLTHIHFIMVKKAVCHKVSCTITIILSVELLNQKIQIETMKISYFIPICWVTAIRTNRPPSI